MAMMILGRRALAAVGGSHPPTFSGAVRGITIIFDPVQYSICREGFGGCQLLRHNSQPDTWPESLLRYATSGFLFGSSALWLSSWLWEVDRWIELVSWHPRTALQVSCIYPFPARVCSTAHHPRRRLSAAHKYKWPFVDEQHPVNRTEQHSFVPSTAGENVDISALGN